MFLYKILLLLFLFKNVSSKRAIVGIPVPGRVVPSLSIFELFLNSCSTKESVSASIDLLKKILKDPEADTHMESYYKNLFHAIGDIDIPRLMGKWHIVVDTPSVHSEQCSIAHLEMIEKAEYTATFSITQYSKTFESNTIYNGFGQQYGPDPGQLLFNFNHPSDYCPYLLIRLGPTNKEGLHDYMVLSQPLKSPTMVFARNPQEFDQKYAKELYTFLKNYKFLNPDVVKDSPLSFVNSTQCQSFHEYYYTL
uniref:Uncharacterized protein n=1 Tax=Rhabditophanes sp. KR3021 TaxID=114890 RepID=A0AC35TYM3_9BILA